MKAIIISAYGSDNWIGGVYYRKNVIFSILQNSFITENFQISILCTEKTASIFQCFSGKCKIIVENDQKTLFDKIRKILYFTLYPAWCLFPSDNYSGHRRIAKNEVYWIADFQHHFYPEYFDTNDLSTRKSKEILIEKSGFPLVLSSLDAQKEYCRVYVKENVYIVPFVSYVENEVITLSKERENTIITDYSIRNNQYAVIMNQFWQHKNHIVVFQAIKELFSAHPDFNLQFVFTGKMEDYRNPDYIDQLKQIADDPLVAPHIKMLGFIDRTEQIAIMKNAAFVIQPSLFEGWGTVVEDAKVLDKTILLSDIPVHREQMNEKCILFDPHDSAALADLIYSESQKEHHDDIEKGIADMYVRAKEYSKGFEQLLKDLEPNRH